MSLLSHVDIANSFCLFHNVSPILLVALWIVFVLCYFPSLPTIEQSSSSVPAYPCSIKITTSCYPLPSICCHDLVYDWFESLAQCLHWNVRKRQARLADDLSDNSDTENWNSCFRLKTVTSRAFFKNPAKPFSWAIGTRALVEGFFCYTGGLSHNITAQENPDLDWAVVTRTHTSIHQLLSGYSYSEHPVNRPEQWIFMKLYLTIRRIRFYPTAN